MIRERTLSKIIQIPIGDNELSGELIIPEDSRELVIFSHGSGSSRFSSRNNYVAKELHKKNISTFLFDLLTEQEDQVFSNRFDIELLYERLARVTKFMFNHPICSGFKFGYFGASTGAASAIKAAVLLPNIIDSIVLRGGRADLVIDIAKNLNVPTLFIVGAKDFEVLVLNKKVFDVLKCDKEIRIIPGASHLFEEHGALNIVASIAGDWFSKYLAN